MQTHTLQTQTSTASRVATIGAISISQAQWAGMAPSVAGGAILVGYDHVYELDLPSLRERELLCVGTWPHGGTIAQRRLNGPRIARGFSGPVAGPLIAPGTTEVRAAHGCVTVTETCRCGAQRQVNRNQGYVERGPWRTQDDD